MFRHGSWLMLVGCLSFSSAAHAQNLRIYHIDVDQGDSTLFVTPDGSTLLVDSGRNGHGRRIKAVMDRAGVTQIDAYVTTHYHADHFGGIDDLAESLHVPVVESYDRGDKAFLPPHKLTQSTFVDYQRAVGEDAMTLRAGDTIALDPAIRIRCISSGGVVIGDTSPSTATDENDMSISLLITFAGFRYFVGGDIEEHTESAIAARDLVTDVDVYQSDHHGSHTSSSLPFMQDMAPTVIVISNGNDGTYHHPRQSTLTRYAGLPGPPHVYQTNKYMRGNALGGNVPDAQIADVDPSGDEGTILLTVEPTGAYTVTYGHTNDAFQAKTAGTRVVIKTLTPNPTGDDRQLEEVILENKGSATVSLDGWVLQDRNGGVWRLAGNIGAGADRTIRRNGQPMSLNNNTDRITLFDASHGERDVFEYTSSAEGTQIVTGH